MNEAASLISYQDVDGICVGTISGPVMLDAVNVGAFGDQVVHHVKDLNGLALLIDFKNVTYMTSQGLTELLRIKEALDKNDGVVRVCGVSPDIYRVFQITNLDKMFSVQREETTESAVRRFVRARSVAADEDAWAGRDAGG